MLDDPLGLIVQGIAILAAGMYPIGFLFGTCSACCNQCRSSTCEGFDLEEAFSHRSGGQTYCPDFYQGPDILSLSFSPTCFGSGVSGTVQGLGGDKGPGPLQSVKITNSGSGYAKFGREAPTFTLDNKNTTPATVSFTLTESEDGCELPLWSIESISLTDGGEGYTDGQAIVVSASKGDTVVAAAKGTITTKPGQNLEPTITASTTSGTGATLTVSLSKTEADPATWTISSISATGASQDYVDGESVNLSSGAAVVVRAGAAVVVTQRIEPDLTLEVVSTEGGSGAQVSAVLASNGEDPEVWSVSDLSIDDAGTGYAVNEEISVVSTNGVEEAAFLGYVIGVGDDGEITQAIVFNTGGYYVDTDELKSIRLDDGGEYYNYLDNGEIESISVSSGGVYYRENQELEPYVRTPTVTVQPSPPSAGDVAEITAVVDDDTASPTFGKVTGLTLDNAGDGYLAWEYISDFEYLGEGKFAFRQTEIGPGADKKIVRLGCRAVGDGFAGKVTKAEWEFPYDYAWDDERGCCFIEFTAKKCRAVYAPELVSFITVCDGPEETFEVNRNGFGFVVVTDDACQRRLDQFALGTSIVGEGGGTGPGLAGGTGGGGANQNPEPVSVVGQRITLWPVDAPAPGTYEIVAVGDRRWTECLDCAGNDPGRTYSYTNRPEGADGPGYGRWVVTVSPPPAGSVDGCATFCGQSGLCAGPSRGADAGEFSGGPYGSDAGEMQFYNTHRMCVRWVCRCYDGTGKKSQVDPETNEPLFPDPYDWYTVKSTTEVGGPVVFGGTLTEKLEAAGEVGQQGWGYETLEHEYLFGEVYGNNFWPAEEGDVFCAVYAFTFYGSAGGNPPPILCEEPVRYQPKSVTPRDAYYIIPCSRCQ
jgi:hypothetical protein